MVPTWLKHWSCPVVITKNPQIQRCREQRSFSHRSPRKAELPGGPVAWGPFSDPGSVQSSFFAIPVGDCPRLCGQSRVTVSGLQAANGGRGHGEDRPVYKGGETKVTPVTSARILRAASQPQRDSELQEAWRLISSGSCNKYRPLGA